MDRAPVYNALTKFGNWQIKFCLGLLVFSFLSIISFAQTTYTWNNTSGGSWAISTNWIPTRTTPTTTDILQFNSGAALNITSVTNGQTIGKLIITNNSQITFNVTSSTSITIGNAVGTDLVIDTGSKLSLISSVTRMRINLAANSTGQIDGELVLGNLGNLRINAANCNILVNGKITNSGGSFSAITSLEMTFAANSEMHHNRNGASIPLGTWDTNATLRITGTTNTTSGGTAQTFGQVILNSSAMTVNMTWSPIRITGNLTIQNGSGGSLRQGTSYIVDGNVSLVSGNYFIASTASRTLTVSGNYSQIGGSLDMGLSTFDGTLEIAGNFSQSAGTITKTSTGIGLINLNGGGPTQTFTSGGIISNPINWNITANSIIQTSAATTIFGGSGNFTINAGATLGIRAIDGVATTGASGHVRSTGTRIFDIGANYIFNGTTNQNSNSNFPTSANTIRIENTGNTNDNTIIWERNVALGGDLLVNQGNLDLDSFTLDRGTSGGAFSLAAGLKLTISGLDNFPKNYSSYTIPCTGIVEYDGNLDQTIGGVNYGELIIGGSGNKTFATGTSSICSNLTFQGGAVTTGVSGFSIGGNVLISTGSTFVPGAFTFQVAGNWTKSGTFTSTGSTIEFNGLTSSSIGISNFDNILFSGSGAKSATGALAISGNVSISNNLTSGSFTHTVGGNWTKTGTYTATGSTINFNGANPSSIGASNFNNLTLSGSGTKTATGILTVTGNIAITNNFNAATFTHTLAGNWTSTMGSFTPATSTITFNGSASQTIAATSNAFYNLTLNNTASLTASNGFSISKQLIIDAGTLAAGSNLTMAATSTIRRRGSGISTGMTGNIQGNNAYDVVYEIGTKTTGSEISGTGLRDVTLAMNASTTLTAGGIISLSRLLTIPSGNTLNMSTFQLTKPGLTTSGTGILIINNTTINPIPGGVNWNFLVRYANPTGPQKVVFGTYSGLDLAGTSGTISFAQASEGNITIGSGQFTVTGSQAYAVTGSNVLFNASVAQTIPAITFNNVSLSGSGDKTLSTATNISEIFSIGGTAVAKLGNTNRSVGSLLLNNVIQSTGSYGSTTSTATNKISQYFGTTGTGLINVTSVCIDGEWLGTSSSNWFDPTNWCGGLPDNNTDVIIPASAPNQPSIGASGAIARSLQIESGATLTISGVFTINIEGNWTNSGTFIPGLSTVNFSGSNDALIGASNFHNIAFSGIGIKSLNGSISTVGNLSISSGANLEGGTFTHTLVGNYSNSGLFDAETSSFLFNTGSSSISGSSAINFYNLQVDGGADLTLSNTTGVSNILTLTSGTLAAGSNLTMGVNSRIQRAGTIAFSTVFTGVLQGINAYDVSYTGENKTSGAELNGSGLRNLTLGLNTEHTLTAGTNISHSATLTIPSGNTLALGSYTLTNPSLITSGLGVLTTQNTGSTPLPAGKSWSFPVIYAATTGGQKIVFGSYNGLTALNSSGINILAPIGDGGEIVITSGNFTSSGNYTNAGSTVRFSASGSQSIPGIAFNNLIMDGSGDKTLTGSSSIAGTLTIISGVIAKLESINHTANSLTLGTIGQPNGTFGSTTSGAAFKISSSFGSTGSGVLTVASSNCTSGLWLGYVSTDWNDAANWCGSVPSSITDVTVSASAPNQPIIGATGAIARNITIQTGATLAFSGAFNLEIYGNWTNNGSFTPNQGRIIFKSVGNQTFGGTSNTSIYRVILEKASSDQVILNSNLTLTNSLVLTSGTLTAATRLSLALNSQITRGGITNATTTFTGTIQGTAAYDVRFEGNTKNTGAELSGSGLRNITLNLIGSNEITAVANISQSSQLAIPASMTLNMSTFTLSGTSTSSGTGLLKTASTAIPSIPRDRTWTFGIDYTAIAGNQRVVYGIYNSLNLLNTSGTTVLDPLSAGGEIEIASGNFTKTSGSVTATGSRLNFSATASQSIPVITYGDLTLRGAGDKTFGTATVIGGTMTVSGSAIARLGNSVTHTATNLVLGSAGQPNGSYGSSAATTSTFRVPQYFGTTGTGILNVTTTTCSSGVWLGYVSSNWNSPSNWCGGVPTNVTEVVIPAGTPFSPIINSGTNYNVFSMTIESGGTLEIQGSRSITINGIWTNDGTFISGASSTLIFSNADDDQSISGLGNNNFYNLTVNKANSTLSIDNLVSINGRLSLLAGDLVSNNNVTMGLNSSIERTDCTFAGIVQGNNPYDVSYLGTNKTSGEELSGVALRNVTLSFTGANTLTAGTSVAMSGSLTIPSTQTLAMGSNVLSGVFTTNGTGDLNTQNTTSSPLPGGTTWTFMVTYGAASGGQKVPSGTYNGLTVSNSSGITNFAPQAEGTIQIISGNLILTGAGNKLATTARLRFSATASQAIPALTFRNLELSGSGDKTLSGVVTVIEDFLVSGTAVVRLLNANHSANTVTLGGSTQPAGSYGSTGSSAQFKLSQYFGNSGIGILTATNGACTIGTWFGVSSSDWNNPSNWCGGIPTLTTDVVIPSGTPFSPVIGVSGGQTQSVNIASGATLSISGAFLLEVAGTWLNNGTFNPGFTSTVEFKGTDNSTINSSSFTNVTFSGTGLKSATGPLTISGNISVANNFTAGAFTHTIGGNWTRAGTFTSTGSTMDFNGASSGSIGTSNFENVTFSGAGLKSATGVLTISGNISVVNNFAAGAFTHAIGGNWTRAGTFSATGSTIDFNGASSASIGTSNFENVTFSGTGVKAATGALTITGNSSVVNNFTAGAFTHTVGGNWIRVGTFTASGSTIDFNGGGVASIGTSNFQNLTLSGAGIKTATGALTIVGNVSVANNFTAGAFTHTVGGNWSKIGAFTASGSTIDFNGVSAAAIGTSNFQNVTLSGAGIKTAIGALTISGNAAIANNFTAGAFTHTVGGNWIVAGTFTALGSTIDFNGASAGSIETSNFQNLTLSGAGVKTASGALTIVGNVSVTNNLTAGAFTHSVGGNWTRAGTFTSSGSTINFNGANAGSIGTSNFQNVIFTGAGFKTATGALTIAGNLSVLSGGNFAASSFAHLVATNWSNSGTFNSGTSTINFNGSSAQSIGASNFNNITFTGSGIKVAGGNLAVAGDVLISSNFSAGSFTHTVGGNWVSSETFTANTSTLIFNKNSSQSISSPTFYNLMLIGSGDKSFLISTAIANNFEIEGAAVARFGGVNHTSKVLFLGSSGQAASSYGSTASTAIFKISQYFGSNDLGILNVATSTAVCTSGNWLGVSSSDWNTASNWCNSLISDLTSDVIIPQTAPIQPIIGISGAKTKSLTIQSGASLTISGAGVLEVAGDWSIYGTFNPGTSSMVQFKGNTNSSINAGDFANISFTGTGTKTINGILTVSGNITPVSSPVIISNSITLTLNTGKTLEILTIGSLSTSGDSSKLILSPGSNYMNRSTANPRLEVRQLFTGLKGWRMIGAPLTSTYTAMTSGFETQGFPGSTNSSLQPNLLWWDETDRGTTLQAWRQPTNLSSAVSIGRGHYFYVFNGAAKPSPTAGNYIDILPLTMSTTGSEVNLSNGIFDFGVTFTARDTNLVAQADTVIEVNQADQGFNLIANPTASIVNWDASGGWTKTNMDAVIYIWDPLVSAFLTWNGTTGSLGSGRIAPYQGFWVRSNASGPSLQLTGNGAKILNNQAFYGRVTPAEATQVIHLQVNGENLQAESFISFGQDGLEGVDPKDAYQLESLAEDWLLLYTYGSLNKKTPLAINHLNPLDGNEKVIPLHLAASKSGNSISGNYIMTWTLPKDLPAEVSIILMDHLSKKAIDMRKESIHGFTFEAPKLPNARAGKSFNPLAPPQTLIFQSPYETGEIKSNVRMTSDQIQRPFTIFISAKFVGEIGYLPDLPKLFGPTPNPFNSHTKISFYLPETQKVEIQITDMRGHIIESLASKIYSAGIHELDWTPSLNQLPHGMYVIRLSVENYQVSQKLIKN